VETCSLTIWDFVLKHKSRFTNPLFDCVHLPDDISSSHHTNCIKPEFSVRNLRLCKPILIRMPTYRCGTGNLDIDDIVRNLLFGATASELADVMNLAITPHGLLLKKDRRSSADIGSSEKKKKISIGKGWYMIKDDPVRGTYYVNRFLNKTQKEWPEDLGEPPQELFPPPPTNSGEVKLSSIDEVADEDQEEEEEKQSARLTRPSNVRPLNLSDVSPWTTRVPGATVNIVTSTLTLQRDSEGHLGIKFDDELVIVSASPWAQRFGVRRGQKIVRVEGVKVRSYNDLIRHIPTKASSFQVTVETKNARGPLNMPRPVVRNRRRPPPPKLKSGVVDKLSSEDSEFGITPSPSLGTFLFVCFNLTHSILLLSTTQHTRNAGTQIGMRDNLRGLNSAELASHLKSVGVSKEILRIMEQDNISGDDFLLLDTPDLVSLGMSSETYTKCVMGIPLVQANNKTTKKQKKKKLPPSREPPKASPPSPPHTNLPPSPPRTNSPPKTPSPTSPQRRLSDKVTKAIASSARRRSTHSELLSASDLNSEYSAKSSTISMDPPGFGDDSDYDSKL